MADSATELGKYLASLANNQSQLSSQISPDDSDPLLTLYNTDNIIVEGILSVTTKLYPTDSLILDHPVYGKLDLYKLDGTYSSTSLQGTYII
jgi:hypothetical protein